MVFDFDRVGKHCGKRRKCWLPAFSPFPTMFLKGFVPRVIKSGDSRTLLQSINDTEDVSIWVNRLKFLYLT